MFGKAKRVARLLSKILAPNFECRAARRPMPRPGVNFRTRLGVEGLEAREVPAIVTWVGTVSEDAEDPLNWAIFVHGPPIQRVPEAGDDVLFTGVFNEDHGDLEPLYLNCVNMHGPVGGGAYNSVTLDYAYTDGIDPGRVTLSGGFTTKAFHLAGGIIDQPSPTGYADTDITVVGNPIITSENEDLLSGLPADFTWTGGILDSTSSGADVNVNSSGSIARPTDGTLYSGSTLNFGNPAAAAVETIISGGGTLLLTGGTGIIVRADAKVDTVVQFSANGALKGLNTATKTLTLMPGAIW